MPSLGLFESICRGDRLALVIDWRSLVRVAGNFYRTFSALSPSCSHELRSQAALQ